MKDSWIVRGAVVNALSLGVMNHGHLMPIEGGD